MNRPLPTKNRWLLPAALLAIYFAIACLLTWPLISQMSTHLVGRTSDAMVHYWNGWWVQQALSSGHSPFQTTYLSYPEGVSLITHNIAWLNILPWLLLEPLFGGVFAYNLIVLLFLAFCGLSMFQLANYLLHQPQAAFIAGLIYMAWPYRLSQLDHPNLIATFCVPLFFLFLLRTLRRLRWSDAILDRSCPGPRRLHALADARTCQLYGIYLSGWHRQTMAWAVEEDPPAFGSTGRGGHFRPFATGNHALPRTSRVQFFG